MDYIKLAQELVDHVETLKDTSVMLQLAQVYALLAVAQETKRLNDMFEGQAGRAVIECI